MDDIIKSIKSGELTRENDEKYSGGLWDYAGEIVLDSSDPCDEGLQEEIYNALWSLADNLTPGAIVLEKHITSGGAIYLTDNNDFKNANIVLRLDGGPELVRCNLRGNE